MASLQATCPVEQSEQGAGLRQRCTMRDACHHKPGQLWGGQSRRHASLASMLSRSAITASIPGRALGSVAVHFAMRAARGAGQPGGAARGVATLGSLSFMTCGGFEGRGS